MRPTPGQKLHIPGPALGNLPSTASSSGSSERRRALKHAEEWSEPRLNAARHPRGDKVMPALDGRHTARSSPPCARARHLTRLGLLIAPSSVSRGGWLEERQIGTVRRRALRHALICRMVIGQRRSSASVSSDGRFSQPPHQWVVRRHAGRRLRQRDRRDYSYAIRRRTRSAAETPRNCASSKSDRPLTSEWAKARRSRDLFRS